MWHGIGGIHPLFLGIIHPERSLVVMTCLIPISPVKKAMAGEDNDRQLMQDLPRLVDIPGLRIRGKISRLSNKSQSLTHGKNFKLNPKLDIMPKNANIFLQGR